MGSPTVIAHGILQEECLAKATKTLADCGGVDDRTTQLTISWLCQRCSFRVELHYVNE